MKQAKGDSQVLNLIVKLQEQISSLDKKMDMVMGRVMATPALMSNASRPTDAGHGQPREKVMHKIICAECGKESSLPFKPNADRPVYCKECFSARKRAALGPVRAEDRPANIAPTLAPVKAETKAPAAKDKKKAVAKKATPKKKTAPKEK